MKVTKRQLKRIIREERQKVLKEENQGLKGILTGEDDLEEAYFDAVYGLQDLAKAMASKFGVTPEQALSELRYLLGPKGESDESILSA